MKFIFLSEQFFGDYPHDRFPQMEQKAARPYTQVYTKIGGYTFAIPLRSHIYHPHVLWTDKANHCGVDFSKAIIILKDEYIDSSTSPHIRQNEFESLRGKEYVIKRKMVKYILAYKKAKAHLEIQRNRDLCNFSTLQYFEEYIKDIDVRAEK
jgi:protein AbiQ